MKPKHIIGLLMAVTPLLMALTMNTTAADRGIVRVKMKQDSGDVREVELYSGYHALVIGCNRYENGWPSLRYPAKDADEISSMLKDMGWTVETVKNPDSATLKRSLNRLAVETGRDRDMAILVWFSGHGHTILEADGTKLGYLAPSDSPNPDLDLLGFMEKAVSMRYIETIVKQILSKHVLMVFDSCFSGAVFQMTKAKPSPYIEEKTAWPVRQFITAGTEDETVPDRSVFKEVFVQGVKHRFADRNKDGYVTGEELGAYLQEQVVNYSNKAQHPQYGKINNPKLDKGDFVFDLASGGFKIKEPQKEPAEAELTVTSNVSGADVLLNGTPYGKTPVTFKIKQEGNWTIRVSADGYQPYETKERIELGKRVEVRAVLEKDTPVVVVQPKPKNTWVEPVTGMEFVRIPGGCFQMGSPDGEDGRYSDEGPVHEVCVDEFWLGKYEVTVGQWRKFAESTGYRTEAEKEGWAYGYKDGSWGKQDGYHWDNPGFTQSGDHPVTCISWNDTREFIKWLNKDGNHYRLPSEAEWEYACRAGTITARYWGNDPDNACKYANVHDQTSNRVNKFSWTHHDCDDGFSATSPFGRFKPNKFGLYDMLGNVWEWCEDIYGSGAYSKHSRSNPIYMESGGSNRVVRGGSWSNEPAGVRCAYRNNYSPAYRNDGVGFRLQRTF